jgi:hypothetical protein
MDFFARLQRMDEQQAERVVFLTGGAFTPRVQQFLDEVPNPRIEKPFDVRTIRAVIGHHMR